MRRESRFDTSLLISVSALIGFGIVMSYSTTAPLSITHAIPPLFVHHLIALTAGLVTAVAAALLPLPFWYRVAIPFWFGCVVLLLATNLFGVEVNGAQRWLAVPGLGFRFQPVELAKFATLLAVAAVIAPRDGHRELSRRRATTACVLGLPPIALLLLQPDLGNAILLALLLTLMLLIAGIPIRTLVGPVLLACGGITLYIVNHAYAMRRFASFRDPFQDPLGAGFQLVQSFVAFGQGGLWGVGLGNGRQKLFYLPEAHTDFILSLVAEELGLAGILFVLGSFAALLIAGTRIARQSRSRFGLLVAFGATTSLCVPAIVNAAVVMGLLPTKGLTLPFLSYGGTSLVVCCGICGVLLGVARAERSQHGSVVTERGAAWR